jgi:hypothetical protein
MKVDKTDGAPQVFCRGSKASCPDRAFLHIGRKLKKNSESSMRMKFSLWGNVLLLSCLAAGNSMLVSVARAQTDYSLRMYSLGRNLAGILDDELSDIFLDPARAAAITKSEGYIAYLPSRSIEIPFPIISSVSYSSSSISPSEYDRISYSFHPITLNYLAPLGNNLKTSISFEIYTSGSDRADSNEYISFSNYNNLFRVSDYEHIYRTDTEHLICNLVLAADVNRGCLGFSLKAAYDTEEVVYASEYKYTYTPLLNTGEISLDDSYGSYTRKYEKSSFTLSTGYWASNSTIRDAVLGFGAARYIYPASANSWSLSDEDADGNGLGFSGYPPEWVLDQASYDSHRDYHEFSIFARTHFDFGGKLRSINTISWSKATGDGGAFLDKKHEDYSSTSEMMSDLFDYKYDGDLSSFYASSCIGRAGEIYENIILAAAIKGAYSRREFDEDCAGGVSAQYASSSYSDTFSYQGDYFLNHHSKEEYYYLVVPIAVEWKVHEFVSLRLGAEFSASHDMENVHDQDFQPGNLQDLPYDGGGQLDYDLTYGTSARFMNGVGINVKDRLIIDLVTLSGVNLASYGYLAARYRF